jgi:hypothetical protein
MPSCFRVEVVGGHRVRSVAPSRWAPGGSRSDEIVGRIARELNIGWWNMRFGIYGR